MLSTATRQNTRTSATRLACPADSPAHISSVLLGVGVPSLPIVHPTRCTCMYTHVHVGPWQAIGYVLMWPVGVPCFFLLLLLSCRTTITAERSNALSSATSFLHRECVLLCNPRTLDGYICSHYILHAAYCTLHATYYTSCIASVLQTAS